MKRTYKALCIGMLIGLAVSGCASSGDAAAPSSDTEMQEALNSEHVASSLTERIAFLLENEPDMADSQRAILQKALDNGGKISQGDYESAWNDYNNCVVEKGYSKPVHSVYPSGLHGTSITMDGNSLSEEAADKAIEDETSCNAAYKLCVDEIYRMSIGNVDLLVDPEEGAVQCLRRQDIVPASYSADDFEEEHTEFMEAATDGVTEFDEAAKRFSFSLNDSDALDCLVANSIDIYQNANRTEMWKPLG